MKDGKEALLRNIAEMCRTVSPQPKIVTLNYPHHPTAHTFEIGFSKKLSSSQNDSVENKPFDNSDCIMTLIARYSPIRSESVEVSRMSFNRLSVFESLKYR